MSLLLASSLLAFAVVHVRLAVFVGQRRGVVRGGAALLIPPLAPLWGLDVGERRWAAAWGIAFAAYALVSSLV